MGILEAIGRGRALSPIQDLLEKKREADETQRLRENDPRLKLANIQLDREQKIDAARATSLTRNEVMASLSQYAPETQKLILENMKPIFDEQGQTNQGSYDDWYIKNLNKDSRLTLQITQSERDFYDTIYRDAKEKWDKLKENNKTDTTAGRAAKKAMDDASLDFANLDKTHAAMVKLAQGFEQEKETTALKRKQELADAKAEREREAVIDVREQKQALERITATGEEARKGGKKDYTPQQLVDDTRGYYSLKMKILLDEDGFIKEGMEGEYQTLINQLNADMRLISKGKEPSWFTGPETITIEGVEYEVIERLEDGSVRIKDLKTGRTGISKE